MAYFRITCEIFDGLNALDVHMAWDQGQLLLAGTKYKQQFSMAQLTVEFCSMFHFHVLGLDQRRCLYSVTVVGLLLSGKGQCAYSSVEKLVSCLMVTKALDELWAQLHMHIGGERTHHFID